MSDIDTDVSATGASSTPAPVATETSPDTGGPSDKGYFDAVVSALEPEGGSQPPKQEPAQTEPKADEAKADEVKATEDDPTEDELKNYSPHARKRIGQLLGQRRELRVEMDALRGEVEPLKAQAKVAQDLQSFVQQTGLTKEDLDAGFTIMGLMRSDPQQALAYLMPLVQELQTKTGNLLPEDLQADVRDGKLTVERALELSKARAKTAHLDRTLGEREEAARQQEAAMQHQRNVEASATAVSDWERSKSTADPDWHLKQGRIGELVELEVRRLGRFPNPKEAVSMHQKALDAVNTEMRKLRPAPKPMQMAAGHASPNSVTEPKSYLEAALMGLHGGNR